ncbi:MAG: methyltransferase domain-containing protein [Xanthomonadales bacterium]|nr:methyltransferase domain-containing protein [Xanthomonadales bacterium]MDH4021087.1 methyltransferase domain-containing protein [Xanthomonadales bacterium]
MDKGNGKTDVIAELAKAERYFSQGNFELAGQICDKVLIADSDNVGALNILGASLTRTGKIPQAIKVAEKACSLSPGNAVYYSNLSYLHSITGNVQKAILVMALAVISDTKNTVNQAKFARLIDHLEFYQLTAETGPVKEAIKVCLSNPDIDHGSFSVAWHSLIMLDPVFIRLASITQDGNFKKQAEEVNARELEEPLAEPFFLLGLKSLQAVDAKYERIITFFRHYFISRIDDYDSEKFLPFLCALAEHCNLNEFVYSCTRQEQEMAVALEGELDLMANVDADTMARIALIACYKDLVQLDYAGKLAESGANSQNSAFAGLIKNTISIPGKITEFHAGIPAISPRDDSTQNDVSSFVAKQYEQNPYPRWRHLDLPVLAEKQRAMGRGRKILVAGCGTGYEPLNLAAYYPEADILGVDLSIPSLAYGKQKADEFGIGNVEFKQADILDVEELGQQFDLITSCGVLHHMEDPVEGWSKLLNCLRPDGMMKVALYSEIARESVVLCRNWIEEQGFAPTPEGIRDFRQAVMDLDDANPLKEIMNWTDFYSMSMCRDLVFHVQEHRVTLPWIKSALDELGLCCLSMRISNPVFRKEYLAQYPQDPALKDLDALNEYENKNPRVFRDMYQFWCCRKDSVTVQRPPAWFYTIGLS